jgi:hypothetical protein
MVLTILVRAFWWAAVFGFIRSKTVMLARGYSELICVIGQRASKNRCEGPEIQAFTRSGRTVMVLSIDGAPTTLSSSNTDLTVDPPDA